MPTPTRRELIVVDVETSGLRFYDVAVEVAWLNMDTGENATFVPKHPASWVLDQGQPVALDMNGYRTRLAHLPQDDGTQVRRLHRALTGQSLGGANPGFDWYGFLRRLFATEGLGGVDEQPHHHRLPDVENYTAGVLGLDPRDLPGLARCCELLGVPGPDHTAWGDVTATARCFDRLDAIVYARRSTGQYLPPERVGTARRAVTS